VTTKKKAKPRRRKGKAGSKVGDDLVAAFKEMAAHMRGEIELEDHAPRGSQALTKAVKV
jgi:hypothetical protein